MAENSERSKNCPFVKDPDKDCYIIGITCHKVDSVLYYCGNHFEKCEIYKRKIRLS